MRDIRQKLVSAPTHVHRRHIGGSRTSVLIALSDMHRLKLLKDEIRKPYFIKLKQFLWTEGVKGANDSPASLKIYPARKHRGSVYIVRTNFKS